MKYDNFNNFELEGSRAKVKVKMAIFREKNIVIDLAPSFMDRFCCNFTQMFSIKIC